jgi:adenylate cyclase
VTAHPQANNPTFFEGQPTTAFDLCPGQHFVIGRTSFTLVDERINITVDAPRPVTEQTFSADYLRHLAFLDARQ